jgi:O-antigen ligase
LTGEARLAALRTGHVALATLVGLFTAAVLLSTAATNVMAAVLCLAALYLWGRYRPFWLLRHPVLLACAGFFAWLVLREALDGAIGAEVLQSVDQFRTLLFVLLWAPLFVAPLHRRVAVAVVLAGLLLFMLTALVGWVTTGRVFYPLPNLPYPWHLPVVLDQLGHRFFTRAPDLAGPVFLAALFGAAHLALYRTRWRAALAAFALLATVVLFFATTRRTSQVGFILCAAFFVIASLPRMRPRVRIALALAVGVGIAALLSAPPVRERMERVVSESREFLATPTQQRGQTTTSTGGRLLFWSIALQVAEDSPWIGTAESAYRDRYLAVDDAHGGSLHRHANPHNEYLHVLGALGVIGLALYLALHAGTVRALAAARAPRMQRVILGYYLIAALSTAVVNSLSIDMILGHFHTLALLVLGLFAWEARGPQEPAA